MPKGLIAAVNDALASIIAPVASDPRKLKPGQLTRLLNSTPLGAVLDDRRLRRHRQRAGRRIGDDRTIDLLKYTAWLSAEHVPVSGEMTPAAGTATTGLGRYDEKRERERARNATIAESGRDIGALPPVADPKRRAEASASFLRFCEIYFGATAFKLPWSKDHLKAISRIERVINDGGQYALAMPRGSGKSTILEMAIIWATVTGRRKFAMLIGPSKTHAQKNMQAIRAALEGNELLAADFPEVCVPIAKLEGIANRCRGQLHQGENTHLRWGAEEIVLAHIKGSQASGAIIRVAGITASGIRGAKFTRPDGEIVRPDLVLIDDPQTNTSAKSLTQCEDREKIISGAILGMAGPDRQIAAFCACTVMRRGDVADVLLDRNKHPVWQGERCKMIYSFPKNSKLWEEYEILRADGMKCGDGGAAATEFYRKHRKAMDDGADVAWPARMWPGEISGIQRAINASIDMRKDGVFFSECQNEPVPDKCAAEQLDADLLAERGNNVPRGTVPAECTRLTAFIDIQKAALFWMVHGWTNDFGGAPVEYGTWPDQQRRYFSLADLKHTIERAFPKADFEGALFDALTACAEQILGRAWVTQGGIELRVEKCLIDANWGPSTELVYRWCRQSKHAAIVMPSHGKYFGAASPPFEHYKRKDGEILGTHWWLPPVSRKRAIRHVMIDTNHWKSFIARRLAAHVGDRGAIQLPGKQGAELRLLVEHLTSEFYTRTAGHSRELEEWMLRPGRDNHWWDGLVGCGVCASMLGLKPSNETKAASAAVVKPRKKRSTVTYL